MNKYRKKFSFKKGLPPGTMVAMEEQKAQKTHVTMFDFNAAQYVEKTITNIEECFPTKDKPTTTWINIDGLNDVEMMQKLGNHFDIHPLVLEDILHTEQRPKMEDYDNCIYIVLKMLYLDEKSEDIVAEQISIILGSNYVISFQEKEGDFFDPIRDRIRNLKGRVRKMGPDYLAYALIDTIVDHYFVIMENIGERIEKVEERLLRDTHDQQSQDIHHFKRYIIYLRKHIWPLRDMISALQKSESALIKKSTAFYLKDAHDHSVQVMETVETYRDLITGLHDIHLSSLSNRMNEVMKTLTIISTIFIPLTFVVGVYGMNFEHMPELKWEYGYYEVMGVMGIIVIFMLAYFKKRKWI
jgi:magnesium transporter